MKDTKFLFWLTVISVGLLLLVNSLVWQLLGRVSLLATAGLLLTQAAITWAVHSRRSRRKHYPNGS